MRVVLVAASLLGACDWAFRLDAVTLPDVPIGIDHDGDGLFAGDNCAAISNPDQLDEDGDGVGNACDPHPLEKTEVVLQEMFDGDAPGWNAAGMWTRMPGAWTSPAADGGGVLSFGTPRELFRPVIQLTFTINDYGSIEETHELVANLDAPTSTGDCAFRMNPNLGPRYSQIVTHVDGANDGSYVAEYVLGARNVGVYARSLTTWCSVDGQRRDRTDDIVERFVTAPRFEMSRIQVTLHNVTVYQVLEP